MGYNEWRFDDTKGKEQIFVHAERNMDVRVKNDSMERVIGNRHLIVGFEKDGLKGGDQREMVYQDKHLNVKRNQIEHIKGNIQLLVGKGEAQAGGNVEIAIEKDRKEVIGKDNHIVIKGNRNEKIDGKESLTVGKDQHTKVGMNYALEAGQVIHVKAGMTLVIEAGTQLSLKSDGFYDLLSLFPQLSFRRCSFRVGGPGRHRRSTPLLLLVRVIIDRSVLSTALSRTRHLLVETHDFTA